MAVAPRAEAPPVLSYEQYLTEGEVMARYDIIRGVRFFMPAPKWKHQRIADAVVGLLRRYERENGRGFALSAPFDVLIRRVPLQTRQPDVLFISHEQIQRAGGVPEEGALEVAPELVIEILSPSDTARVLEEKVADFRSVGVQECWVVDPDGETVTVLPLAAQVTSPAVTYSAGETVRSLAFPDLAVPVADIFDA